MSARGAPAERGQAAVEFLAVLPVVLVVALVLAQGLAIGYASVLAGDAAEAGALAVAGGGDPSSAARAALPGWSHARATISVKGGEVTVQMRPPMLLKALGRSLDVHASAAVENP
jgi:hypothetical protein